MSFIETLREQLLDMPIHSLAKHPLALGDTLGVIVQGEEDQQSVLMQLFIGLKQARYENITLRDMAAVCQGIYNDPLYIDLTCAFGQFAQSEHLEHQLRPLNPRCVNLNDLFVALATLELQRELPQRLSSDEKDLLRHEAHEEEFDTVEKYIGHYIDQLLYGRA